MEVVQTLAFATPRFLSWSFDARLLTPTACCTPAAVDFRSRPIPNSHSHARLAVGLWHKAIHSKGGPEARSHLAPVGGILARSDHPAASAAWPRIVVFAGVVVDYGLGPSDSSCSSSKLPSPFERQEFII